MTRSMIAATVGLAWALATATAHGQANVPEIVSVERIWDAGQHNAFTDLIRLRGKWYCTFREAEGHVGGDGRLRVLTSDDGKAWRSAALLAEEGIDLRDPKLSVTPDGRLMIVTGGSVYAGTRRLQGRQPRVAFSADGTTWTAPQRVLDEGDWLWRVTWHDGRAYGVSYHARPKPTSDDPKPDWPVTLVTSDDGVAWKPITRLYVQGHPNETTLRFLPDGEMIALMRREAGDRHGHIGTSRPPYREWTWHDCGHQLGGPNFILLPDGKFWAGTRFYRGEINGEPVKGPRTALARMGRQSLTPILALPSGGDTSYPGLVWHDGLLWMSYYASHEGKTAIYLAKIRLPATTPK